MYILALLNWWNWFKRLWQTLKYKRLMKLGTSMLQKGLSTNNGMSKIQNKQQAVYKSTKYTRIILLRKVSMVLHLVVSGLIFQNTWGILHCSGWERASRWGQAATEQWILLSVSYQTAVFHLRYIPDLLFIFSFCLFVCLLPKELL